jgi:hypothetical protein
MRYCDTCASASVPGYKRPCIGCGTAERRVGWRPKWLRLLGRAAAFLLVTVLVMGLYVCVARGAAPVEDMPEEAEPVREMQVSVEDITAVAEQLAELDEEIIMLARLIHSEAGIVKSTMEQAAVVWCVLNRVDAHHRGDTIREVITATSQFAWEPHKSYSDELYNLAKDVVTRWLLEARGVMDVGRVLPAEYVFFAGRGGHNWFRTRYRSNGEYWDWSLPDPYEE